MKTLGLEDITVEDGKLIRGTKKTTTGIVAVYPYKYNKKYNCYINVSGYYTLGYVRRLYKEEKLIFA